MGVIMPFSAYASCGSAFCPVNTQWNVQGVWTEPGLRLDMRYEYIPQKQPRQGSKAISVGEIPAHHDEKETINQNILSTLDYTFNQNWGISLSAPLVSRSHEHIHNHHGTPSLETWDFTNMGDARISGRYQQPIGKFDAVGVTFGLKLPTGRFHVANTEGEEAERSLQPGTGTTDMLIGAFFHLPVTKDDSVFSEVLFSSAFNEREHYKPGDQIAWDMGYRHALTPKLSGLAQLNVHYKWNDTGEAAEPANSGNYAVHFSPGASYTLSPRTLLYGYAQLPLYQHVRGVQLTEDWAAITGVSFRF